MIITRTPYRISFFGGGTDYPAWYREHGGEVLATTINKYCYLTCRYLPPFFEHRIRIVYSKVESCNQINEIQHPAVRAALHHMQLQRGIELHHDGDLPARSGMGSSSAFTVGLVNALHGLKGEMVCKHQLAQESIHLEQEVLQETVGSQDQVSAAYGGFNHIAFHSSGEISVHPFILPRARLLEFQKHLLLFYTGIKRTASEVAASFVGGLEVRRRQFRILRDMVTEAMTILASNKPIRDFGELLHEAWLVKRSLSSSVSCEEVDQCYQLARSAGASGGKLTGAGGGGFLLLFAPPEAHADIAQALAPFFRVPFAFENYGSQVIFFDPEEDFSELDPSDKPAPARVFRESETHSAAPWSSQPQAQPDRAP